MKLNKILFFALLFLFSKNSYSQNLNDSLVAYYPFNGNAWDYSGNRFDGVIVGATFTQDVFGNQNSALRFDGIDDFVQMGNIIDVSQQECMSVAAWFRPDTVYGQVNRYAGILIGSKEEGRLELRYTTEG